LSTRVEIVKTHYNHRIMTNLKLQHHPMLK
jgi:hypothetical protein